MRNIEAAVSPAEDPCMHFNTFWDPEYSSEQVRAKIGTTIALHLPHESSMFCKDGDRI